MPVIREVDWDEAEWVLGCAEDRNLRRRPSGRNIRWYVVDDRIAVAAMDVRPPLADFKRCFVMPAWRGCGIGESLILHRLSEAKRLRCKFARVASMSPGWFLRHGWKETRRTKNFTYLETLLWP